jgi:hypothetical protein
MILFKKALLITLFFLITSCVNIEKSKKNKIGKKYFHSKGFALIYEETLFENKVINKKINNENVVAMHSFIKRNTPIKIINPENSKFVETKISKNSSYPDIFNIVISKKIAKILNLSIDNPYVEIQEIKVNKKFVAKKANTFEEEREVADTAPVSKIDVDILSTNTLEDTATSKKVKYFIQVSDFYYKVTADELKKDLVRKTKFNNFFIEKINTNKYRLLIGPFKSFNALKSSYISLNNLGFEGLNIYKE